MLDSNSIDSWNIPAENSRKLISSCWPHLVTYIDKIHQNPSYYAGYFLKFTVGGALGKNGSSGAEQNHSSIVVYNGKEQIGALPTNCTIAFYIVRIDQNQRMTSIKIYSSPSLVLYHLS
jgi:hypothetical protein